MKQVAKAVLVDADDQYLMLYRSAHPVFGNDADLPGGTVEDGEQPLEAMIREVDEEAGITIRAADITELYRGADYSTHGTEYQLYTAKLTTRPEIILSWEHASYEWVSREVFLQTALSANDTYMHMVGEVMKGDEQE